MRKLKFKTNLIYHQTFESILTGDWVSWKLVHKHEQPVIYREMLSVKLDKYRSAVFFFVIGFSPDSWTLAAALWIHTETRSAVSLSARFYNESVQPPITSKPIAHKPINIKLVVGKFTPKPEGCSSQADNNLFFQERTMSRCTNTWTRVQGRAVFGCFSNILDDK